MVFRWIKVLLMTEQQIIAIQAEQDQMWEELGDHANIISHLFVNFAYNIQKPYIKEEQYLISTVIITAINEIILRKYKKELEVM